MGFLSLDLVIIEATVFADDSRKLSSKYRCVFFFFQIFCKHLCLPFFADEEAPLNLSMKGRNRSHSIWSPGSLCEQEMKSMVEIRPDSSVGNTVIKPIRANDARWQWDPTEREAQTKVPTIGPSGEKTFTVSFSLFSFLFFEC